MNTNTANTAFSFPADVTPAAASTSKQRARWADMALAVVFDEADIGPKGWRRHTVEGGDENGLSRMSRANPKERPEYQEHGLRWYAQATVFVRKNGSTFVTFTVDGTDEVAVALREAAVRLGWGS